MKEKDIISKILRSPVYDAETRVKKREVNLPVSPIKTVYPDPKLINYINSTLNSDITNCLYWTYSTSNFDVPIIPDNFKGVGNLYHINDIHHINRYFRKVNLLINKGDYFIIKLETKRNRRKRVFNHRPALIREPLYFVDFLIKRVLPKFSVTKAPYFWFTKGKNQVISISEGLARLIYCGFSIVDYTVIDNYTYIIARKEMEPNALIEPQSGLFIRLPRVGKDKNQLQVYKIRTMHPYSEYLQEYLFEKHGTKDGDKIENDFRVTRWGKFLRKFWIDEFPMIVNLLKGDLKLIGVRPLSETKFNIYPEKLQNKRIKYKPGLIPPYYADLPKTPEDFFDSEEKYLNAYEKNPIRTDLKYLGKSLYNIIIKGERSR